METEYAVLRDLQMLDVENGEEAALNRARWKSIIEYHQEAKSLKIMFGHVR